MALWPISANRDAWRSLLDRVRLPLAVACLVCGAVAMLLPVWSGWWTAHVQAVRGREFEARLHAVGAPAPRLHGSGASTTTSGAGGQTAASSVSAKSGAAPIVLPPPVTSVLTPSRPHDVPQGSVLAELRIPEIGVDSFVLDGLTFAPDVWTPLLRSGPAHLEGSALPGQPGNDVIFGHLNIWGSVFLNLDRLKPGEDITLNTTWGTYVYRVTSLETVPQTDLGAVAIHKGGPAVLELVTCEGLLDHHRLIVSAILAGSQGASAGSATTTGSDTASAASAALNADPAVAVVQRFFTLMRSGQLPAARALWTATWRAAHPANGWASEPDLPPGATFAPTEVSSYGGGQTYVAGRVMAPGPYGTEWGPAGYVVRDVGGILLIDNGGLQGPAPLTDLQSLAVHGPWGQQSGSAACGPYRVQWTAVVGGATPGQRTTLRITDAQGAALPPLPLMPLTFGTTPTWCGDMLGDGGTDLVVTAAFTGSAAGERQASIFRLEPGGARLLGQVTSWGDNAYPRPAAVDRMYPYEMLSSMQIGTVGTRPLLLHPIWAYVGLDYQPETQAFPDYLRRDLDAQLQVIRSAPPCASGTVPCLASTYVRAFYDGWELKGAATVLAELDALLPPSQRAWMAQQATAVRWDVG